MADVLFTFRRLEALVNAATMAVARAGHLDELRGGTARYLSLCGSERLTRLWPLIAPHTMNDLFRAAALLRYAEEAVALPGDLIECGVAGGGFSLLLGSLVRERGLSKTVWMCDSFAGLPAPDRKVDRLYEAGQFAYSQAALEALVAEHGLSDICKPVPGWFADTLPALAADRSFCLAHIDGDLYASCRDAFASIYPATTPGGAIVVDDYSDGSGGALVAVHEQVARTGEVVLLGPCTQAAIQKGEHGGRRPANPGDVFKMTFDASGGPAREGVEVSLSLAPIRADDAYIAFLSELRDHWSHRVERLSDYLALVV